MAGAVQTQTQTQGKIERHGPRDFRAEKTTASADNISSVGKGCCETFDGLKLGKQTWYLCPPGSGDIRVVRSHEKRTVVATRFLTGGMVWN